MAKKKIKMSQFDSDRHPTIAARLKDGSAYIEDGQFYGRASDGTTVVLGAVRFSDECEAYLVAHPSPDSW